MSEAQLVSHLQYIQMIDQYPHCGVNYVSANTVERTYRGTAFLSTVHRHERGHKLRFSVESRDGAVLIKSPIVDRLQKYGNVQLDTEPLLKLVRVEKQKHTSDVIHRMHFPSIYTFQEWLVSDPRLVVNVNDKPHINLNLLTMKSEFVDSRRS